MVGGARYKVARRRRREGKTNYRKRYIQVLSRRSRLVIRRTNKYIEAKIVDFDPRGDIVRVSAHSIELFKSYGWLGSGASTMAAYLTGYLLGKRAMKRGISAAIPDIGLRSPVKESRVFAVIKGAIDAGLKVPVSEEVLPSTERIKGEHVASYARELKESSPEKFSRIFSLLLKRGLDPSDYPKHFEQVLRNIDEKEGSGSNVN
ncbi:MAG: 50S ribosomal protein L18 [Fervidicoccaceae archaeon]